MLSQVFSDAHASNRANTCTDALDESNIAGMAKLYRELGKRTFAICDKQDDPDKASIEEHVELLLMHDQDDFERLVVKNTTEEAMRRFSKVLDWPPHLKAKYPVPEAQAAAALAEYFDWSKGNWGIADFLAQCSEAETPEWIREASLKLKAACSPAPAAAGAAVGVAADAADGKAT